MQSDVWIYLGIIIFLALMFFYIYIRDSATTRRLERFSRAIEDLNQQNHRLKHLLAQKHEENKIFLDDMKLLTHKKIQDEINKNVLPLLGSLKDIELIISEFKNSQQNRIDRLEAKTSSFDSLPNVSYGGREKDIISLAKEGKSATDIARELHLSKGEVELMLRLNKGNNC